MPGVLPIHLTIHPVLSKYCTSFRQTSYSFVQSFCMLFTIVVIPYSYLALPPSRPLFPSATETVKPEGPSSPASRYQARPLIGPSDTQDA